MKIIILIAVVLVLLLFIKWAFLPWFPYRRLPHHRTRHMRLRLHLRLHPGPGHATVVELWLRWGRLACFRRSGRARRSMPFWERVLASTREYSILVGRGHYRHALRLPLEEHAVVKSPPRGGKTGWLASVILHYPGPVISTTTKHDVFELTSGIRARRGPVHVFNPQGVGNVPSTFRWNPLEGCEDPATAIRRADAFASSVTQKGVEDATFWASKASDYLRAYFHAAALAKLDLRHVARWVTSGPSHRSRAHPHRPGRARRPPVGRPARRTARRSQQNRPDDQNDHEPGTGVPRRPGARRRGGPSARALAEPGALPARARDLVPDRRIAGRGRAGRTTVRLPGQRTALHRGPARQPDARRTAGPTAAHGPGRGHPDLPRPTALLAGRLRRQGHPDHHCLPAWRTALWSGATPRPGGRWRSRRGSGRRRYCLPAWRTALWSGATPRPGGRWRSRRGSGRRRWRPGRSGPTLPGGPRPAGPSRHQLRRGRTRCRRRERPRTHERDLVVTSREARRGIVQVKYNYLYFTSHAP